MSKVVSFTNQKGGVGKTTTCVNFATYVALSGKRVLLIDSDPQGNTSSGMGIEKNKLDGSIYDVLIDGKPAATVIKGTCVENLDILPTNIDLAGAEIELVYVDGRENRLKNAIASLRLLYDYIFIDCPPSLGLLTLNALVASDSVIIPFQCEYLALEGLTQLMSTIKLLKRHLNPQLDVDGVVLTMYNSHARLSQQVADEIRSYFGKKVFQTVIPRNIRLSEAPSYGLPIALYDKNSSGALAYKSLVDEYLAR